MSPLHGYRLFPYCWNGLRALDLRVGCVVRSPMHVYAVCGDHTHHHRLGLETGPTHLCSCHVGTGDLNLHRGFCPLSQTPT